MNDELQKALLVILNKATSGIESGISFLSEQLPDVIHQLLLWHAVRAGVIFSVSIIIFFVCFYFAVKAGKMITENHDNPVLFFGMFVLPVIGTTSAFFVLPSFLDLMQILVAPKIFLIEYAASLVK